MMIEFNNPPVDVNQIWLNKESLSELVVEAVTPELVYYTYLEDVSEEFRIAHHKEFESNNNFIKYTEGK